MFTKSCDTVTTFSAFALIHRHGKIPARSTANGTMSWPAPFAPVPRLAAKEVHRTVSHRFPETVEAITRAGGQVKQVFQSCNN